MCVRKGALAIENERYRDIPLFDRSVKFLLARRVASNLVGRGLRRACEVGAVPIVLPRSGTLNSPTGYLVCRSLTMGNGTR